MEHFYNKINSLIPSHTHGTRHNLSRKYATPLYSKQYLITSFYLTLILLALQYGNVYKKKIDFNLRRDHQKMSYERRAYESVDEKSLS